MQFINIVSAAEEAVPNVHDMTKAISAASALYVIITLLGGAVIYLVLRDRNSIADGLNNLSREFREFREDLLANYARKEDLNHLARKLDRYIEIHSTRGTGRRDMVESEEE